MWLLWNGCQLITRYVRVKGSVMSALAVGVSYLSAQGGLLAGQPFSDAARQGHHMCGGAQGRGKSSGFCADEGKNPGRPPGSSSLSLVLIFAIRYPPKQLLIEVRAGNAPVIFAISARWARPQGTTTLDAGCPYLLPDNQGALALSAGSGQQEAGFTWPGATHGCPPGKGNSQLLPSPLFFWKWCKGSLTWIW